MIIDAFLARDEDHLVDFRLDYLDTDVDLFIIAESSVSFGGERKPMHFSERKARGQLPENVLVYEIEIPPKVISSGSTVITQDYIRETFSHMVWKAFPEATVFFLDVDEIPSVEQVRAARQIVAEEIIMTVPMKMFSRKANWELLLRQDGWFSPKLFRGKPESKNLRSHFTEAVLGGEFGAHFSFLEMGAPELTRKFSDYGHQEYNQKELWSEEFLSFCDRYGLDHLGRADRKGGGLLRHLSDSELPDVAIQAISVNPAWRGERFKGTGLGRRIRAKVVGAHIHAGSLDGPGLKKSWPPSPSSYIWPSLQVLSQPVTGLLKTFSRKARQLRNKR